MDKTIRETKTPPGKDEDRPSIHLLGVGEPGAGKSTMFATFPARRKHGKRMVVYGFDPPGKMWPYVASCGEDREVKKGVMKVSKTLPPVKFTQVTSEEREIKIYHFSDRDPENPTAWEQFGATFKKTNHENCDTVVVDSLTAADIMARKLYEYKIWPREKGARPTRGKDIPIPAAGATDELEEFLCCRLGSLDANVCVAAHFSDKEIEFQGGLVRSPHAPGRLKRGMAAFFEEVYCLRVVRLGKSQRKVRFLLTESDGEFQANTVHGVPDFTEPTYDAIWSRRIVPTWRRIAKELGRKLPEPKT